MATRHCTRRGLIRPGTRTMADVEKYLSMRVSIYYRDRGVKVKRRTLTFVDQSRALGGC